MKRKLIIVLFVLLILSIAIGTSPIVDYFYSLADEADTAATEAPVTEGAVDDISPRTVLFAVILSSVTVIAAFIVYLRKRKV